MLKIHPRLFFLIALCLFTLVYAATMNPAGHFSVDEAVYHYMTRSFAASRSLAIHNGYEATPSKELVPANVRVSKNRLAPQYPYLFPILASPLYRIAGFRGLYILNAVSFLGVAALCYALARKLFRQREIALDACIILFLATYAWEYAQGAWPHALSMLFVTAAIYLSVLAFHRESRGFSAGLAFAAGLIAGFGAGIRLDAFFVFPAVIAPFIFFRPFCPWHALAAGIGSIPGLLVLTITNYVKFGIFSPFSYGNTKGSAAGILPYLPLVAILLAVGVFFWLFLYMPRFRKKLCKRKTLQLLAIPLAAAGVYLCWPALARGFYGFAQLVVDLRTRNLGISEPSLTRTTDGAMVYFNFGLKKALLQSCPYLTCLALPLAALLRDRQQRFSLALLFFPPLLFIAPFSYFAWHGGLSFNMRYLLPALPFTAILTAFALHHLINGLDAKWQAIYRRITYTAIAAGGGALLLGQYFTPWEPWVFLTLPLILSGLLLILLIFYITVGNSRKSFFQGTSGALLIVCLIWSGLVAFGYDFPRTYAMRSAYADIGGQAEKILPEDAILFTNFPDPLYGLLEKSPVKIAVTTRDDFSDFTRLVHTYLASGVPVYASFPPPLWQSAQSAGMLDSLTAHPLLKHTYGVLARIEKQPLPSLKSKTEE